MQDRKDKLVRDYGRDLTRYRAICNRRPYTTVDSEEGEIVRKSLVRQRTEIRGME